MFPNHAPNPENQEAMRAGVEAVRQSDSDLGIVVDTVSSHRSSSCVLDCLLGLETYQMETTLACCSKNRGSFCVLAGFIRLKIFIPNRNHLSLLFQPPQSAPPVFWIVHFSPSSDFVFQNRFHLKSNTTTSQQSWGWHSSTIFCLKFPSA